MYLKNIWFYWLKNDIDFENQRAVIIIDTCCVGKHLFSNIEYTFMLFCR